MHPNSIKGTAIKTIPLFIQKEFGEDALATWMNALPPESRSIFEKRISLSRWYPIHEAVAIPTQTMCDLFYEGDLNGARDAGQFSAEWALKGIYAAMLKVGSPGWFIARAMRLGSLYYRPCRVKMIETRERSLDVRLEQFPSDDPAVLHRLCGWVKRATELSGATDVQTVITASTRDGDPCTVISYSWSTGLGFRL